MLKMKKLFTLIVFSCLFVLVVAGCGSKKMRRKKRTQKQGGAVEQIKKRGKLVVGVKNDTNLFGLKNPSTGQVEGFDVDVAKALAKRFLGMKRN